MNKPLIGAFAAFLLAGASALAGAVPAAATPLRAADVTVDFAGTVALDDCSGSLIRMPNSADSDPALVMTNGHCLETGMPSPGQVITDQPSSRTFGLLDHSGNQIDTLQAERVVYSTMTSTDVTLYRLNTTYAAIQQADGIGPLTLSAAHPVAGSSISVVSGYWQNIYSCSIDGFVYQLHEGGWAWNDSVRYTPDCHTIGGTSGSPVIDTGSGLVVAVNNTGNENGESCTVNNPCEVDANGATTVHQGINYAEETWYIPACFVAGNQLDLTQSGCGLPRP